MYCTGAISRRSPKIHPHTVRHCLSRPRALRKQWQCRPVRSISCSAALGQGQNYIAQRIDRLPVALTGRDEPAFEASCFPARRFERQPLKRASTTTARNERKRKQPTNQQPINNHQPTGGRDEGGHSAGDLHPGELHHNGAQIAQGRVSESCKSRGEKEAESRGDKEEAVGCWHQPSAKRV